MNANRENTRAPPRHNLVSERFESSAVLKTRDEDCGFWKHRTLDCGNGTQEIEETTCAVYGEGFDVRDWNEEDRLLQVRKKRQRWSELRVAGGADCKGLQQDEEDELGK